MAVPRIGTVRSYDRMFQGEPLDAVFARSTDRCRKKAARLATKALARLRTQHARVAGRGDWYLDARGVRPAQIKLDGEPIRQASTELAPVND